VLDGLPVGQISAGALVALVVLMILTGRLVTRQQMLDLRADRDKWEASATKWQEVSTTQGMTLERLLEYAETSNHALTEIQAQAGMHRTEPGR
jgi:hypothetical protein